MDAKFQMVAKTFQGLEDVLCGELIAIGAQNVETGLRMVTFEGNLETMYRANLCCRTALRILKPIVKFTADSTDELYDKVRELDWEQFLNPDMTFAIDSTVNSAEFTHSKFVTYRVKDAIADHFNDNCGRRPSIRLSGADLLLNVHISDNRVTISLDSSGEPLSKRGYRLEQTEAPINEALAAGIILKTGWRGDSDFVDPMCGSGTFLIEAALIAANINPGIYRESFAFEKWKDFNQELFEEIYNDDSAERDFAFKIYGGDISPEAVLVARKNVKNARVEDMVEIECKPITDWTEVSPEGLMVTNPPYGERLRPENINLLYKSIGSTLKKYFKGWHAWIIGYRDEQFDEVGLKPSVKLPFHNGSLECSLREYVLFDGKYSDFVADGGSVANADARRDHGPKKVKRISDDEWNNQARKFNSGKSFSDNPNKKKKNFNREKPFDGSPSQRRQYEERPYDREQRSHDRDQRPYGKREQRPYGERDRRQNGDRSPRRQYDDRPPRQYGERGQRSPEGYAKPENRDRRGVDYQPGRSRNPRIPKSSEEVVNPIHMRQRKGWKKEE